jgi:Uma2 family endonuclease
MGSVKERERGGLALPHSAILGQASARPEPRPPRWICLPLLSFCETPVVGSSRANQFRVYNDSNSAMATASPSRPQPPRRFDNGEQWLAALGDVPLSRIIFDPWPGTATEADLLHMVDHEKRLCELIDGTLVEKPVGCWEGLIAANIIVLLAGFVNPRKLGAVFGADSTLRMKSGRIRLPDVSFVSNARLPQTPKPVPTLAPDLAIEVLSESNTAAEMRQKLAEYFQSGTRLAWLVDPATRSVAVYTSPDQAPSIIPESGDLDGGTVLPGMSIRVADMFLNVPNAPRD